MKRILVAGGAGFLGSHLCKTLIDQGHCVVCLDNLYTGSENNLSSLHSHPNFTFIQHDICKPIKIDVDEIYNLACPASPIHYQSNPILTTKTSVFGIYNLLELARDLNIPLLQASTSEVYGDPEIHPQPEYYWGNVNPIGIRSCYDEGKRCAETLCFDFHRQYGVKIKVVRIFNTYGPHMHPNDGRVVSNFIVQALKNENITIYGNGQQTRSFCYVSDLIEGFCKMMRTEDNFTGPINLGNPGEFTMLELAHKIIEKTNSSSTLIFRPLPSDDPKQRKPNIDLAVKYLKWSPQIDLDEGLQRTVPYFEKIVGKKEMSTIR